MLEPNAKTHTRTHTHEYTHTHTHKHVYVYIYIYICMHEHMRAKLSDFVGVKHLLTDLVVFRIWCGFVQICLLDLESMFDGF